MGDTPTSFQDHPQRPAVVRVYRLGEEPGDDLSGTTTAAERIALVWELSRRMWALGGWQEQAVPLPELVRDALVLTGASRSSHRGLLVLPVACVLSVIEKFANA